MTRKHYILIADTFKKTLKDMPLDETSFKQFYALANNLSSRLKEDNPNFDKNRFIKACGFDSVYVADGNFPETFINPSILPDPPPIDTKLPPGFIQL